MKKITFLIILLSALYTNAQVAFEDHVVIDNALYVQSPNSVFSADLDGDGDTDVLTSSYWQNKLVWLENTDGAGVEFTMHTVSTTVQAPWGVYAADLDNDGDLDIMTTALSGNNISWFENTDGNGTFVLKQATYAYRANLVMPADVDNDGDLDLIWSAHNEGDIKWLKNSDGLGTFTTTNDVETNVSRVPGFHMADINGDGLQDIVSGFGIQGGSQGVSWYRNVNGFTFAPRSLISAAVNYVTSVYSGDVDGDGDIDVVSASSLDQKIAWYANDGTGSFGAQQILSTTAIGTSLVKLTDLDSDGDLDVVFGSNDDKKIAWLENLDGQGNFGAEQIIGMHSGDIREMHFSDFNDDGNLDFVTATSIDNHIKLYKNSGNAETFTASIITKHIDGGRVVFAADIDGDGDKDIINASYWDDKISWFENLDGLGNFYNTQRVISDTFNGATSVFAGDVDGDGFIDVLATSLLDGQVVWYRNTDGLGDFAAPQIIDSDMDQALRVYLSDIDADGDQDVFALARGKIMWYENLNGLGSFSSPVNIDAMGNSTMYALDFGDLDGDGDLDVSAGNTYGLFFYLNNDGQGTFGTRQAIDSANHIVALKMADIDEDGDTDIVYTAENNITDDFVGWRENSGSATFGPLQLISSIVNAPKSIVVADFDNDGDIDVASSAQGDGGVIAWYENTDGQGSFANTQQIVSQNSNSPFNIFAADIDGNNTIDIVSTSEHDDKVAWHKNQGILSSNLISGSVGFDFLNDGCTEADALISGLLVVATGTNSTDATFTQENGQFQIFTTDTGAVTTQITSQLPTYYAANPGTFASDFTGYGNSDNVNFCIQPTVAINDLSISFYPTALDPRPGFTTSYVVVYRNVGTTQLTGSVTFEFDGAKMNFLNASQPVSSQTINTLTFNYSNLNPFETKDILLNFNVFAPPVTNINEILTATATINPLDGDNNAADNVFSYSQTVVGSYDPNDITCLEGDQVLIDDAEDYLHYLIRFQNTGTASAINVRVDHVLDDNLDWTTMQLESLSHNGVVNIRNGSEVSIVFDDINLADSTTNEPASHGFITFKIKPKSDVLVGDIVDATAAIYFDFNPPIVTNTASTEFVDQLSVTDSGVVKMKVYPNPTNGILNIVAANDIEMMNVYNHLGQLVFSQKHESQIDVSALNQGVYILTIKDVEGSVYTQKIVKN